MRNEIISQLNLTQRRTAVFLLMAAIASILWMATGCGATETEAVEALIGPRDSILVLDRADRIVISKNDANELTPASILKIFTSLAAMHYLGSEHRYRTEFFIDDDFNLKIKGFGDPRLISEIVQEIARLLAALLGRTMVVNDLIVDDSFFSHPLTIPGISSSSQPYDAPNGALCVNFNTVYFKRTASGYISSEPQTPLLPYAEAKIRRRKLKSDRTHRIVLSNVEKENTIYAGKLFEYFLRQAGVRVKGIVRPGLVKPDRDKLIFRYPSRFSLADNISALLEHSNNFIANQLLISAGIKAFGPPGNLEKGVAAARAYASEQLGLDDLTIVEGSGISRQNRVSARQMMDILEAFEPYFVLLRQQGRDFYKTGTLFGINTRAGYIVSQDGGRYRYVVMVNTEGKTTRPVMRRLMKLLE